MTDTIYRRPTWVRVRLINPLLRAMVLRAGLGRRGEQNLMRVLRVRGRRSGRQHEVPVRVATWEGKRYVVSLQGEAEWARNLRAAGTAQLLVGTSVEPIVAHEMRAEEKVAFLQWYCRQPAHRLSVRAGLKVNPANLTPADIDRLVRQHPIFRLDPAGVPGPASRRTHRDRHSRCTPRPDAYATASTTTCASPATLLPRHGRKHGINPLHALTRVTVGNPWLPEAA